MPNTNHFYYLINAVIYKTDYDNLMHLGWTAGQKKQARLLFVDLV